MLSSLIKWGIAQMQLAGWPSPNLGERGAESRASKDKRGAGGIDLQTTAMLAGWGSPRATDGTHGGPNQDDLAALPRQVALAGWATPASRDEKGIDQNFHDGAVNNSLPNQVAALAGYTTPQAHDVTPRGRGQKPKHGTKHGCADLNTDAMLVSGTTPSSSPARTANSGQLAPAFPLWLMGFPETWRACCPGYKQWELIQAAFRQPHEPPASTE